MVTGTSVHIRHVAACPEVDPILCAEQDIPDHRHDQTIAWFRLDPMVNVGLGAGWQVSASLPLDLRAVAVRYETMDGGDFHPPYADIHHRDETLAGPVDGLFLIGRYAPIGGRVTFGARAGTTLPFGATQENPFALTERGLTHRHIQLGTGTFVPTVTIEGVLAGTRWGAAGWVTGRLPLYANSKGYQPGTGVQAGVGPTWRVVPPLTLLATVEGSYEGPERWSGTPYGGRATALVGVTGLYSLSDAWVLQAQARVTVLSRERPTDDDDEGTAVQRVVGTLGVSWTPRGRRDDEPEGPPS